MLSRPSSRTAGSVDGSVHGSRDKLEVAGRDDRRRDVQRRFRGQLPPEKARPTGLEVDR